MKQNLSKAGGFIVYIIWTIFWGYITNYAIIYYQKPVYIETTLRQNQVISWYSSQALIVEPKSNIHIRSTGSNFSITNQAGEFICTGIPVEILPHEQEQSFECAVEAKETTTLNIKGYATIYTTSQTATVYLERDYNSEFLPIFAVSIPGSIFGVSIIMGLFWLIQPDNWRIKKT